MFSPIPGPPSTRRIIDPQGAAYPKTIAALPPSPGMTPAGAVPVQTQSFRPPASTTPISPAARSIDPRVVQTLRGLATSGDPQLEKYALERLSEYTKPTQAQVVTIKRPDGTEESMLYNAATGQFAPVPGGAPKPSGAIQAEVDRLVAAGADRKTAQIEATKRAQGENLPTDVAGKLAMMETAQAEMKNYKGVLTGEWGAQKIRQYYAAKVGYGAQAGEIGTARRAVRGGIEGALRIMTGAAAPDAEVSRYEEMYMPTPWDDRALANTESPNVGWLHAASKRARPAGPHAIAGAGRTRDGCGQRGKRGDTARGQRRRRQSGRVGT